MIATANGKGTYIKAAVIQYWNSNSPARGGVEMSG